MAQAAAAAVRVASPVVVRINCHKIKDLKDRTVHATANETLEEASNTHSFELKSLVQGITASHYSKFMKMVFFLLIIKMHIFLDCSFYV